MPNPRSVHEIQIPDQLKVTTRGDSFLFWDSGEDDPQRVFGTDRNIDRLEQNAHWFMVGTFKVSPELFVQLFTIHALVDSRAMPMVYVLLQSKTQADYERVFRKLFESRNTLAPSSILANLLRALSTSIVCALLPARWAVVGALLSCAIITLSFSVHGKLFYRIVSYRMLLSSSRPLQSWIFVLTGRQTDRQTMASQYWRNMHSPR